jgi:hypothetical protein
MFETDKMQSEENINFYRCSNLISTIQNKDSPPEKFKAHPTMNGRESS